MYYRNYETLIEKEDLVSSFFFFFNRNTDRKQFTLQDRRKVPRLGWWASSPGDRFRIGDAILAYWDVPQINISLSRGNYHHYHLWNWYSRTELIALFSFLVVIVTDSLIGWHISFCLLAFVLQQSFPPPKVTPAMDPRWYIRKPLGFSYFPKELVPVPRAWVETTGNLVFWRQHEKVEMKLLPFPLSHPLCVWERERESQCLADILSYLPQGGHFAALERPHDLADDLVAFLEQVWREDKMWCRPNVYISIYQS